MHICPHTKTEPDIKGNRTNPMNIRYQQHREFHNAGGHVQFMDNGPRGENPRHFDGGRKLPRRLYLYYVVQYGTILYH